MVASSVLVSHNTVHGDVAATWLTNDGNPADVVYFGCAKVFDAVKSRFLIATYKSFGLGEKAVHLSRSYLTRRTCRA